MRRNWHSFIEKKMKSFKCSLTFLGDELLSAKSPALADSSCIRGARPPAGMTRKCTLRVPRINVINPLCSWGASRSTQQTAIYHYSTMENMDMSSSMSYQDRLHGLGILPLLWLEFADDALAWKACIHPRTALDCLTIPIKVLRVYVHCIPNIEHIFSQVQSKLLLFHFRSCFSTQTIRTLLCFGLEFVLNGEE